ncbi:MAG: hypothetical protein AB7T06_28550 [Kofleriaceae bacterium]
MPEPLDEATASERARAKTFADIVDKAITGRAPAAMSADDRALLEVATVIRAANGQAELGAQKQRSIVEDALRQAIGDATATTSGQLGVVPIGSARRKWLPWAFTGASTAIAAAAMLVLWLRQPQVVVEQAPIAQTPTSWTSRPADPLIGPIARENAGDASARIDYLFADRLEGYRDRRLSGRSGGTR